MNASNRGLINMEAGHPGIVGHPNPFFDAAGIAAGIAKMPLPTFLFFTWIGQMIKMTLFALAGKYSVNLFTNFFN